MNSLRHRGFVPYIRAFMTGLVGSLPTAPVSVVRSTVNVAIFFAAVLFACISIGGMLPFPKVDGIYQKWAHFRANKDQYDALFVGSSRFYRQIMPREFDAAVVSGSGRPVRSFNMGLDAMWPPESCFVLRELMAQKPQRLKWVFIEVMEINTQLADPNLTTRRTAYWHDWAHTRMVFQAIAASRESGAEKMRLYAGHTAIFLRNSANQGRGAEWVYDLFRVEGRKAGERWVGGKWKEAEGFTGRDSAFDEGELGRYKRSLAKARSTPPPGRPIDVALQTALTRMIADVRAAGAEPILIMSPSLLPRENFTNLPAGVTVWSFRGPNEYPELYAPEHHYDAGHLNTAGARVFTERLAARFIAHVSNEQ